LNIKVVVAIVDVAVVVVAILGVVIKVRRPIAIRTFGENASATCLKRGARLV
jgi:hypothetical protein